MTPSRSAAAPAARSLPSSAPTKSKKAVGGWRWSRRDTLRLTSLTFSITAFWSVQNQVPDPYLDEIFHIPQTQRYCHKEFDSWDPAITTPPGSYFLAALPLMTLHIPCTPPTLRAVNLLFSSLIIPALVSGISELLQLSSLPLLQSKRRSSKVSPRPFWRHLVQPDEVGIVVGQFPLAWFFGLLFYTDVASLAGVLGATYLGMKGRPWGSSLVGAWSITVRQTNVVWLALVLAISLLSLAGEEEHKRTKDDSAPVQRGDPLLADVPSPAQLLPAVTTPLRTLCTVPRKVLRLVVPYIPTFLGFLLFLHWNGGIVLGHKELHKPVLHVPQLFYFLVFCSVMLSPSLLAEGLGPLLRGARALGFGSWQRAVASLSVLGGMNAAVYRYTTYHPFLLADNRHYVFYLLRWVFLPFPAAKYLVTPIYLFGLLAWVWRLRKSATLLWTIGFIGCTALVLIPTPLIEPRYFLVPALLLRLQLQTAERPVSLALESHKRPGRGVVVWAEWGWYVLVNLATLGLFLGRKFRWEGWDGWMRFMW